MKKFLLLFPLILFAACVSNYSSGVKVDPQTLSQFHKGQTTYAQVVQVLGQPTNFSTMANGGKMAMYISTDMQHNVNPLIPFGGVGSTMQQSNVTFMFDANDVLQNYTTSQNNYGGGSSSVGLR